MKKKQNIEKQENRITRKREQFSRKTEKGNINYTITHHSDKIEKKTMNGKNRRKPNRKI